MWYSEKEESPCDSNALRCVALYDLTPSSSSNMLYAAQLPLHDSFRLKERKKGSLLLVVW
jgi:hypothetical protein